MELRAVKHLDPVVGVDLHAVIVAPSPAPVFVPHPHVGFVLDLREYITAAMAVIGSIAMTIVEDKVIDYLQDHPDVVKDLGNAAQWAGHKLDEAESNAFVEKAMTLGADAGNIGADVAGIGGEIANATGAGVGMGGGGRPIFVNGFMRTTAGTHTYHVPGLHFPLGESFAPVPSEEPVPPEPSNDAESYMGSKTVLANNDPMSFMALPAMSCWSIGLEPPEHNGAHTHRTYPSMPSSFMLPIPVGRPVLVGGPPIMNMAAAAVGLFKALRGSAWARKLADKLHLKPGFLRCNVLGADPVNMITGEVIMQQHDFTVSGRLPLVWGRYYSSHQARRGAVGAGWQTLADVRLELLRHEGAVGAVAHYLDRATAFDAIPDTDGWAERTYDWQCSDTLYRLGNRLIVRTRGAIEYGFELPAHWQRMLETPAAAQALTLPVVRMADLNGNAWTFCRRPDQSLSRLIEWKGERQTGRMIGCAVADGRLTGGYSGLITAVTLLDVNRRTHALVSYEHDRNGNLVEVLDAMGHPHHFAYADRHLMVRHTSVHGMSFYYSHKQHDDGVWRVDHAWGDHGLFDYRFVFDLEHRETRVTDSLGHVTVLQSNARGFPVARIDALGGVWSYRYDPHGRTSAQTDPAGRITQWEYDAYGNLLAQTLPDGSAVRTEYDLACRPVSVTDPGGGAARYVWDERGNLLERSTPAGSRVRYEYDGHGQLVAQTAPGGAVTRFVYDDDGNLSKIIDALGHRIEYTYDARANLIRSVDASGSAHGYEYDLNGNSTRATGPDGRESFYRYDANDNLTHYCDPAGQSSQLEYSGLGLAIKRTLPDSGVVEYRYDTEARLTGVVNERGESYRLLRDALGQVIEEIDYWGQSRRHEYSASGELLRSIDALGRAIDYRRDALGRIVEKQVPDPRQPDGIRIETFTYDRAGNLVAAENPDSRIELMHDAVGRIVSEKYGAEFEISHRYDADGDRIERTTRITDAGTTIERVTRYEYDVLKRVVSISADGMPPIRFERDARGRIRTECFGDALRRELSYTAEGRLERQTLLSGMGSFFAGTYAYDVNGEMIEKHCTGEDIEYFRYDSLGQLAEHRTSAGGRNRFIADRAGDLMTTRIREGAARLDAFGGGLPRGGWFREGECGGAYHVFDRAGDLVRKRDPGQDITLQWDGDGLLIESCVVRTTRTMRTDNGQDGGTLRVLTQYSYDALHRRTKKVTQLRLGVGGADDARDGVNTSSCTTRFFWDGDVLLASIKRSDTQFDRLMARMQSALGPTDFAHGTCGDDCALPDAGAGAPDQYHEWVCYPDTPHPLAWLRETISPPGTEPGQAVSAGVSEIPVHLPQSTIDWITTDPNGMPIRGDGVGRDTSWRALHAPWGAIDRVASGFGFEQPLRFLGQYEDLETGFFYNRYRYYDPATAQYISIDPIRLGGGDNLYRYASNPSGWTDSLGLSRVPIKRMRYFGHPDPNVEESVRAKIAEFLQRRPDLVESGEENIAIALLDDGTLTEPVLGNQIRGHPEARLIRMYPNRIKCLWSERQPCDQHNYFNKANPHMHMNDAPCQTLIHGSEGMEEVYYYIMTGSGEAAELAKVLRKYAAQGTFLPLPRRA